jgi:hypothetical protein
MIEAELPKPHFHQCGDLVIPFNSPRRYHWWTGGQSVEDTIKEMKAARIPVRGNYTSLRSGADESEQHNGSRNQREESPI